MSALSLTTNLHTPSMFALFATCRNIFVYAALLHAPWNQLEKKMRPIIRTNVFLVILVTLLSASGANAGGFGKNIVVVLGGTGKADPSGEHFYQLGLGDELAELGGAICFDIDLIDAKTGNVIGSGADCLSLVTPSTTDNGMSLTATTFFYFPGGNLVSQGQVTVQPILTNPDGIPPQFTHVTGAAPLPGTTNVIYGDRKFRKAAGSVRLSGLVNLSLLESDGIIDFDCVFIIDLEKRRRWWH